MKKLNAKEMKTVNGGTGATSIGCPCLLRCARTALFCNTHGGTNCDEQEYLCELGCCGLC